MAAAVLVAVSLPLGYYHFGQQRHAGNLEAVIAYQRDLLSERAGLNPQMWRFEALWLEELLARGASGGGPELRRITDEQGEVVAEQVSGDQPWLWPTVARSAEFFDSGRSVGRVENPALATAAAPRDRGGGLLALLVATGVFLALKTLPLRALRQALGEVAYLASHDPLTGLPNRTLFRDRLGQVLGGQRRDDRGAAVLFLDLDRFKEVNDTLGHAAGDDLLRQVAARLAGCLRRGDTLARLGGDEFAVIQGAGGARQPAGAANLAARLVAALAPPFDIGGHEALVGVSVGIALAGEGSDPEALLQGADLALYRAKTEGAAATASSRRR
jgi:diguanylate cyclase (GGDEF)-like protein